MLHIIRNKDNTFDMVRFSGNSFNQISRSQQGYKRRREIYKVIATELRNDFEVYPFSNMLSVARIVQDDTAAKPTVIRVFGDKTIETLQGRKPEPTYQDWLKKDIKIKKKK